ncbi:MAG TPA: succinate dehydrogenase, cytochrome b556 subunit [Gammaproteobacteria bacterium]|nr:succinate dehydrogenase, cytochrome b556 subunit [Gammaproteobacteria bacterium]
MQKPVYLDLLNFAFPITAIVSILHRLSGLFLFFLIPVFLRILQKTLYYPSPTCMRVRVLMWLGLTAFIYHLFAGIRHLCMDVGVGEDLKDARYSSYAVLLLTAIFSLVIGLRIC